MASAIMGDPATLNTSFRNGHPDGTGANFNGTTTRAAHPQGPAPIPVVKLNALLASAFP
jgi:hypothetical protein